MSTIFNKSTLLTKMKNILLILIFFSVIQTAFAQQKHFELDWEDSKIVGTSLQTYKIPYFKGNHFDFDGHRILFSTQWKEAKRPNKNSFSIKNIKFETISENDLHDISISTIPLTLSAQFNASKARTQWYASLTISPIIKEGGVLKRIKSFDVSYNYQLPTTTASKAFEAKSVSAITNSVLATGTWYKFFIEKSGVYRIDRNFLQNLGVNPSNINPSKIKIYGQGGRMLPLINQSDFTQDIQENAIYVFGEDDGTFDTDDYILFYGIGVDEWNEDSQTHRNIFADEASYFITFEGDDGKRIANAIEPAGLTTLNLTTFDDYQFHEKDEINIGSIGRRWFGDKMDIETEKTFNFNIPGIDVAEPVTIGVKPAADAGANLQTNMSVTAEGMEVLSFTFLGLLNSGILASEDAVGSLLETGLRNTDVDVSSEDIAITLNYDKQGNPAAVGYLDYITVEAKRFLRGYDKQYKFTYKDAATELGIVGYLFSEASNILQVWDITDIYNISTYQNTENDTNFNFKANLGEQRNYIAIDANDFYTPIIKNNDRQVANQNIKGTIFQNNGGFNDVDYLIITPQFLVPQAERLANFHRNHSNLNVKTVTLSSIYNEFSSGNPDAIAIRNFVRYVYENADLEPVQYLCLFGDASFDYKNRIPNNNNIVPTFFTHRSFLLSNSYVSDDYFAMMDEGEGVFAYEFPLPQGGMDIAVGRMLVSTPQQADEMVTKIEEYHNNQQYAGSWRNNISFLADDVDVSWEDTIQNSLNDLADEINTQKPFININKIYTDAYAQEVSAGGERYPKAKEALLNDIEQGTLVVDYIGHGGPGGIASERLFNNTEAQNLRNKGKYPLLITVTCDLTKFDNPSVPSAGEYVYWNTQGGAIALITTTRSIFVQTAIEGNIEISKYLFDYASNGYTSIAEALRQAKSDIPSTNKRSISYIGDPALKLAIPQPKVNLTHINDVAITDPTDVLEALAKVKLSGNITDEFDNPLPNYNGEVTVTVYDKTIQRQTLANDGTTNDMGIIILDFETLGEVVFRGKASVIGGNFDVEFVVPKDIAIPVANGKVSFYAQREDVSENQTGHSFDIEIGGIDETAPQDNIGPTIQLFMNNENFVSGGITNESPLLLATLNDENGINTASGIGHDIIAILDGDETNPFVLNNYYEAEIDDYTTGNISYPLRDLEPGLHTITLRAWDVYNNSATAEIQFLVLNDRKIQLERVLNYPNPFVSYTEFWFHHNRPFEPLDVQIQIFTISGKIIRTINQTIATDGFSREIAWDGRDDFGEKIGKGVYIYKITAKSTLTNSKTSKFEKLVIL